MKRKIGLLLAGALLAAPISVWADASSGRAPRDLEQQVRHELLMLPYYNVFDNLEFQVQGTQVVLTGQVTWPVLKSDAVNVVRRIPGVTGVTDKIEVLPLSPFDNRIRFAEYRTLFRQASLYRYALGAQPSIHIIVKNGNVTLDGVVDNQTDKNLATLYANQVPGVFSVTNNLRVGKS
jgi:hyperosmotically inducible protein